MALAPVGPQTELVLSLQTISRADLDRVGAKAANLGDLAGAGFPVPDGFVLTTEAFGKFLAANSLDSGSSEEAAAASTLPSDLEAAVRAALLPLNGTSLAIRSSAVDEDLPGASYAGQYETVLGAKGPDEVLAGVRKCWVSAFSQRVAAYRAGRQQMGAPKMAVLLQRLVEAEAAGVAFTANPVTGDQTETMVNAVKGLGERLASGQASPDEWIVKGGEAISRHLPERAIEAADIRTVAEMARKVEEHFGSPQDVEWAIQAGKLYLLQARPITAPPPEDAAQLPIPIEVPPGFWVRDVPHYPQPLSPLFESAVMAVMAASFTAVYRAFSVPVDGAEYRQIGGWTYSRTIPMGGKERPAPPAWLVPLLIRVVPQMRGRIKGMVASVRSDLVGSYMERWESEWRPAQVAQIADLRSVDLAALSDEQLALHFDAVLDFVRESFHIHGLVTAADLVVADLVLVCQELLGWDDQRALQLLSGLSHKTGEASRRLADLAWMAKERPAVRALLERIDDRTVDRLAEADREYAEALGRYLREFGCQPLHLEVIEPTLAEQPALVLRLIRDQIARRYVPDAEAAALESRRTTTLSEARALLASRTTRDRERFDRALARAERGYPIRDEHEFYLIGAPLGLLRFVALEIGRRLAGRGQIARADDVFFLTTDEARAEFVGGGQQRAEVAHRRAERAWALANPGPASYGERPGPPISIAAFPPEAKQLLGSLFWFLQGLLGPTEGQQRQSAGDGLLRGVGASPGRYTGTVRVITRESEFHKLQAGDVLVCPSTSPVWSVLFPSVGAVVTDAGGILSHPAIIAREYRVPAVVAVGNATELLRDGQVATVDGSAGIVQVSS